MSLTSAIQAIVSDGIAAGQLADVVIGTVTSEEPLEITIDTTMQVIKQQLLLLTEPVIEKKIPVLTHRHYISTLTHTHGATSPGLTGRYLGEDSLVSEGYNAILQGENIVCWEDGKELPIEDGYIILNRKLETDDKVIMLRVQSGQRFIVLSRVFEREASG